MRRKEKQAQTVPLLGPTGQPTHPRQELITPESLDSRRSRGNEAIGVCETQIQAADFALTWSSTSALIST